jgi:hypothetical protein
MYRRLWSLLLGAQETEERRRQRGAKDEVSVLNQQSRTPSPKDQRYTNPSNRTVCIGLFAVAPTGLLDGCRVTKMGLGFGPPAILK